MCRPRAMASRKNTELPWFVSQTPSAGRPSLLCPPVTKQASPPRPYPEPGLTYPGQLWCPGHWLRQFPWAALVLGGPSESVLAISTKRARSQMESKASTDTGLGERQCWAFPSGTSWGHLASKAEVPDRFQNAMRLFLESVLQWREKGLFWKDLSPPGEKSEVLGVHFGPHSPLVDCVALRYYPILSEPECLSVSIGERNHSVRWQEVSSRQVALSPVLLEIPLRSQKSKVTPKCGR